MAELWDLPVIFVIENNQYAMGTSVSALDQVDPSVGRGEAFGIPGEQVDGMDVLAVKEAGERPSPTAAPATGRISWKS